MSRKPITNGKVEWNMYKMCFPQTWGEAPPKVNNNPSIHDLVIKDMESRKAMGLNKYGTILQANNGRNALKDAYEEALDLAMYLKQALEERDNHS